MNGSLGARRPVPASRPKRPLWDRKRDDRRNVPQRARRAVYRHSPRRDDAMPVGLRLVGSSSDRGPVMAILTTVRLASSHLYHARLAAPFGNALGCADGLG